jgi:hypothetical protein
MMGLIAARDWLTAYRLPPSAHELNPAGPVWSHLKRSLASLAKRNQGRARCADLPQRGCCGGDEFLLGLEFADQSLEAFAAAAQTADHHRVAARHAVVGD